MQDIDKIIDKYLTPFKPTGTLPKTPAKQKRDDERKAKDKEEIQAMLSDDFIYDVIEYTMSKGRSTNENRKILKFMSRIIAVYGGGFKPPTAGHFEIVDTDLIASVDEFIIYVGGKVRDGIDQTESILVWDIYQKYLANKVKIEPVKSPIGDIIRLAKNNPQDIIYFIIGYRDGRQDDLDDVASRTGNLSEKYPNIEVKVLPTFNPNMSGTNARKALDQSEEEFIQYLPSKVKEKSEIFSILRPSTNEILKEEITKNNKCY